MTRLTPKLTRRSFAAFFCATPALALARTTAPDAEDVQAFLQLSSELTGFAADGLDANFAASLLDALRASGRQPQLAALFAGESALALEEDIIDAWYTGTLALPTGRVVAALQDALVWQAAAFALPGGLCAGVNAWTDPPSASVGEQAA